jgi:hypothetical protein
MRRRFNRFRLLSDPENLHISRPKTYKERQYRPGMKTLMQKAKKSALSKELEQGFKDLAEGKFEEI